MNTEKIQWKKEFSIGNTAIDHDHKKIIEIYNGIVELSSKGNNNHGEGARYLTEMTNYALNHFKKEENYMQQFSYPEFNEHKHYHMEYIYEVSMFNLNFFEMGKQDTLNVLKFLRNWWTNHIQNVDRKYEEYREQIQAKAHYGKTFL